MGREEGDRPAYQTEKIPTVSTTTPTTERIRVDRGGPSIGRMGMWLLIASLAVLFGAAIVGYLIIRMRAPEWPPPGSPALPGGVWIGTGLLVVLSALLARAESSCRKGQSGTATRMMTAAAVVAVAFLTIQVGNWMQLAAETVVPKESLLVWGFYVLTFLHAVHVLAGIPPLILVALRTRRGHYTPEETEGIHLVGMYWHFLLVTWVVILGVLSF